MRLFERFVLHCRDASSKHSGYVVRVRILQQATGLAW